MAVEVTVIKSTVVAPTIIQQIVASMPEWFQLGGAVMWLLLFTSFLVTIVSLERAFSWLIYLTQKERPVINDIFAFLNKKEKAQALICSQTIQTPALLMLKHGIETLPFSPKEKMHSYAKVQVGSLSQGQTLLVSAVITAILLGFLGTALQLIFSFNNISLMQTNINGAVIGAIANALIPLATGLCVSLLAFIPYKIFQTQLQKLQQHLENIGSEFNHICQQKQLITNQLSEIMKLQEKRLASTADDKETETVAEQSEMPYHYEFKEGSDEVNVSLHKDMKDLQKTSQSSLMDMYKDELNIPIKKEK
ncbi:MotA/TolQ/ExbB proton channel family protein [Psychromonas sp. KJ10-10]|uniref:MotA/TolQ/ExbB proton channel family protein n=1 Tax=Psychromonas sp. KJ10-10 TaxID=3391823 RepID=UPI0039B5222B